MASEMYDTLQHDALGPIRIVDTAWATDDADGPTRFTVEELVDGDLYQYTGRVVRSNTRFTFHMGHRERFADLRDGPKLKWK